MVQVAHESGVDVEANAETNMVDGVQLLTLDQAAAALGLSRNRLLQAVRDGRLVIVAGPDGKRAIPADLIDGGGPVKGLPGVITLLRDAQFSDAEIVEWLYRADDTIPGTPIEALRANRGTEIKRRAQAAGF